MMPKMGRSEALKAAWSLTHCAGWSERNNERETAKNIPKWALKFVYGRLKSNPDLYCDALSQTGGKFRELLGEGEK